MYCKFFIPVHDFEPQVLPQVRQPRVHLARRKVAFAVRSAGPWNKLPQHIAEAPTLSSFKDRLEARWCSIFANIV